MNDTWWPAAAASRLSQPVENCVAILIPAQYLAASLGISSRGLESMIVTTRITKNRMPAMTGAARLDLSPTVGIGISTAMRELPAVGRLLFLVEGWEGNGASPAGDREAV